MTTDTEYEWGESHKAVALGEEQQEINRRERKHQFSPGLKLMIGFQISNR